MEYFPRAMEKSLPPCGLLSTGRGLLSTTGNNDSETIMKMRNSNLCFITKIAVKKPVHIGSTPY